jgi:hypothetical protein
LKLLADELSEKYHFDVAKYQLSKEGKEFGKGLPDLQLLIWTESLSYSVVQTFASLLAKHTNQWHYILSVRRIKSSTCCVPIWSK